MAGAAQRPIAEKYSKGALLDPRLRQVTGRKRLADTLNLLLIQPAVFLMAVIKERIH
jgi:hypothetical protein